MLDWIPGLFAHAKSASPVFFLAMGLASGFALFAPHEVVIKTGVDGLVEGNRAAVGAALIFSSAMVAASLIARFGSGLATVGRSLLSRIESRKQLHSLRAQLHSLTPDEKAYLIPFALGMETAIRFHLEDGIASGLVGRGILYRPTSVGDMLSGFDHSLQPWARTYLSEHPDLLDGASEQLASRSNFDTWRRTRGTY